MSKQRFRVAIVGAGHISQFHIRALRRIPCAEVLGVFDVDANRAEQVRDTWRLPSAYSSLEALYDERPDVVHVLTPPASHAENTLLAIENGCHVYVEKPLATSVEDCDRIDEAARARGVSVCVGHSLLTDPTVARAIKAIEAGAIGEPIAVDYFKSQSYPPYAGGPLPVAYQQGGYPFRDVGIHALYFVEKLLGGFIDAAPRFYNSGRDPLLHFDEWRVLLQCVRGTAQVHLSWTARPPQCIVEVKGARGVLRADLFSMTLTIRRQGRLPQHAARVLHAVKEGAQVSYQALAGAASVVAGRTKQFHGLRALVQSFYQTLAEGKPAPVTPSEARPATEWTERIARQADEAKWSFDCKYRHGALRNRVLVTGAHGFIGRRLVARLLQEGHSIRALVRRPPTDVLLKNPRVEVIAGDLGDPDAVDKAVQGCEVIYHLGAAIRGSTAEFDRGTIAGTRNVVESALRHNVRKLVYISSLSVLKAYPPENEALTEDSELEPFPAKRGNYTRTKLAAEQIVTDAVRQRGLRAVILRPAEVIGRGAAVISSGVAQRRGSRLIVLGNGRLQVPMVHIEDLIDGIQLAEQSQYFDGSIFQFVDPVGLTQNEIIDAYTRRLSANHTVRRMPRGLFYGLAFGLQSLFLVLRRSSPLTVYRLRSALATRRFDCSRAERLLGWQAKRGVRAALADAIDALVKSPRDMNRVEEHCQSRKTEKDARASELSPPPYVTPKTLTEPSENHKIHV